MNSKDAFKNTLKVMHAGRPVFIPIIYRLAARIEQIPLRDMQTDSTYYANLLEGAYKLLQPDAIITNFDSSLEAELFGCQVNWQGEYDLPEVEDWSVCNLETAGVDISARIPIMLEAVKRLVLTQGKQTAIAGVITGPVALTKIVSEKTGSFQGKKIEDIISLTGNQLIKLTKSICETKVDAVIIREEIAGEKYLEDLIANDKAYSAIYTTIFNLLKFYNIFSLLVVKEKDLEKVLVIGQKLKPNGIILNNLKFERNDLISLQSWSDSQKIAVGLALPVSEVAELPGYFKLINEYVEQNKPKGFFYTTQGEVPPDIPLEGLRGLIAQIKGVTESG
jgi:hypothetical protein